MRRRLVVLSTGALLALLASSEASAQVTVPTPRPTTTTTAPRAGGVPLELALPLLSGGVAMLGGGAVLLRRRQRQE
jgi:LPXTG-motif cell wall-anchored protein